MNTEPDNAGFHRTLLEHRVESLQLALTQVDKQSVRDILLERLAASQLELRDWPQG